MEYNFGSLSLFAGIASCRAATSLRVGASKSPPACVLGWTDTPEQIGVGGSDPRFVL